MNIGNRNTAQRIVNAENDFLEVIMARGFTREEAIRATGTFRKLRVIKLDAVGGRISVVHGAYLEPDVIRNAVNYGGK